MIARLAAGVLAALLLSGCAPEERTWPSPSPALYEIEGPGGQRGWLFGTIHALPPEVRWRTPAVESALANAGVLVVEVAAVGDETIAEREFSRRAGGDTLPPLTERVAPADRPALARFMTRAGADEGDFERTDTWAAALILANSSRRLDRGESVDRALIGTRGEVIGLESHGDQYAVFDGLPQAAQANLLMALARDTGGEEARVEAWLTGDLDRLERASAPLLDDPALRQALHSGRNQRWVPRIVALTQGGRRPFVAVGAAHLVGDESLPLLLSERGFVVRRIQ